MRNNETLSGNTGSLPKGMQFLQHGTPGPMPDKSEAELERAEQAEFNLFVEDENDAPAAVPEPGTAPTPAMPERAPIGDMTASIASIIASVFEGAEASRPKTDAPQQQTAANPVILDTADASRPLPKVDAADYSGAGYESGVLPQEAPDDIPQPQGYADPGYMEPQGYTDPGYMEPAAYENSGYIPQQPVNPASQQPQRPQAARGSAARPAGPANPSGSTAARPAAGRAATSSGNARQAVPARNGSPGNAGKTGKTGKNGKTGKTGKAGKAAKAPKPGQAAAAKTNISRDAARLSKASGPVGGAPVFAPGTNYVNISDSGVRDSASFKTLLQDMRERQKDALPDETVSVRSSMKTVEQRLRLGRVLNPVRYVIILLMVMCLAGRKYEWMALGIMAGYPGTKFAIFITAVSMLVSWRAARSSVRDLLYMNAGYETWLLIATILTSAEAVLHDNARSLIPLLAIAWCFAGIADFRNDRNQLRADKAMVKAKKHTGIRMKQVRARKDDTKLGLKAVFTKNGRAQLGKKLSGSEKGRSMIGKSKASTTGFVRHQAEPDAFHRLWTIAGPILFVLLLILSAYISGRTGKLYLTTLVMLMDMATPAALVLCCIRPYELFTANTRRHGVVAGWFGMQQLSGNRSMLLYDNDFYPAGTMEKKDIRLYSHIDIRTFVSYAACLGIKGKIGYDELLINMMREVNGSEVDVTGIRIYESGIEGIIHKEPVFLGSFGFMQLEGFNPPQTASHDSLFLSIGEKLAGEIKIDYQVKHGSTAAFRHLQHEPGLYTMVAARNFLITPAYIGRTYKTNTEKVICMKAVNRRSLAKTATLDNSSVCGFVFRDGIVSYSMITAGARRTYRAGFWMSVLSIVAAAILILRTSLTLLGRYGTPTGIGLITLNIILFLICELVSRFAAGNPD